MRAVRFSKGPRKRTVLACGDPIFWERRVIHGGVKDIACARVAARLLPLSLVFAFAAGCGTGSGSPGNQGSGGSGGATGSGGAPGSGGATSTGPLCALVAVETGLLGEFGRGARLPERSISANDAPRPVASQ
jgi:hypothetical protein